MPRMYSSHATAAAASCQPHELRAWRNSGFLSGVGTREGKSILYTQDEIARIAVAVRLARCGFRLRDAFDYAEKYQEIISIAHQPASGASVVLTIDLGPTNVDRICSKSGEIPFARMTLDVGQIAHVEINLTGITRVSQKFAAEYELRHAC